MPGKVGRWAVGVAVALSLTLAGCTDEESPAPPADPLQRDDTTAEAAWTADLDVIGQPSVRDGVAVVLARAREDELDVVAVDAATGEQLWDRPWSPGGVPTGFGMSPTVTAGSDDEPVVVLSEPPGDLSTESAQRFEERVVAVDLRTGEERSSTDPMTLSTPVAACSDGADACLDVFGADSGRRMDVRTGELGDDTDGPPADARSIGGAGLYSTSDRPGEKIGVRVDGETVWERPVEDVVGPGTTSDTGWTFEEADGLFVGWLRAVPAEVRELAAAEAPYTVDASLNVMVAFEADTGERLWSVDKADHDCLGDSVTPADTLPRLRCVYAGTVTYAGGDGEVESTEDVAVSVEGFDPRTGEARWTEEMSPEAADALVRGELEIPVRDGQSVVVPTPDGRLLVDVESGDSRELDAESVFACEGETVELEYATPWVNAGQSLTSRFGGRLLSPCDAAGEETDSFSVAAVRDAGQDAGDGRRVLAVEGGLQGFELDEE